MLYIFIQYLNELYPYMLWINKVTFFAIELCFSLDLKDNGKREIKGKRICIEYSFIVDELDWT